MAIKIFSTDGERPLLTRQKSDDNALTGRIWFDFGCTANRSHHQDNHHRFSLRVVPTCTEDQLAVEATDNEELGIIEKGLGVLAY